MGDKKDLPAGVGDIFCYAPSSAAAAMSGTRNAGSGGGQTSSAAAFANFNQLSAAMSFNPMAGYSAAAAAAALYSPFSMLPFAAAIGNPTSSPFLQSNLQPNMLTGAFQPPANPLWPGLLPPEYLLNVAALQSLQQPMLPPDSSGETFNDILRKMPRPAGSSNTVTDAQNCRGVSTSSSASLNEYIPTPPTSTKMGVSNNVKLESETDKSSKASSSKLFSATSLAISEQKSASRAASAAVNGRSSPSTSRHSSLATLAEIASSLNNRYDSSSCASSNEKTKRASGEKKRHATSATTSATSNIPSQHTSPKPHRKGDKKSRPPKRPSPNAGDALDFSRGCEPTPKSEQNNAYFATQQHQQPAEKRPKLEPNSPSPTSSMVKKSKSSARKEKEKDNKPSAPIADKKIPMSTAAAAATGIFGSPLSSDLKMDPNLLNASAMAWAALSNQLLFANVQNEILNRAAASLQQQQQHQLQHQQQQQQQQNFKQNSATNSQVAKELQANTHSPSKKSGRRSGSGHRGNRGQPPITPNESTAETDGRKDAVDATIDDVIRQQQQPPPGENGKDDETAGRGRRGRGARGGITVREQLAARRNSHVSTTPSSTPVLNGRSANSSISSFDEKTSKFVISTDGINTYPASMDATPQTAALDLSIKTCSRSHTPNVRDSHGAENELSAVENGIVNKFLDSLEMADGATSVKKRRLAESDAVRIPLTKGWRRQTCVRSISSSCVRGDVIYYAPDGKRMGSYAEVIRYLNKHNITDIGRDNFSFSCKVLVGEFLHIKADNSKNGIVKLTEEELNDMVSKMQTPVHSQVESSNDDDDSNLEHRRNGRANVKRRGRSSRNDAKTTDLQSIHSVANSKRGAATFSNESFKPSWEAKRLERERDGQFLENERKRKLDTMRNQRIMEAMQRAKDKEIRVKRMESLKKQEENHARQMAALANMEKEKVRQQLLFTRALEARRRQDERERLYAEKLIRREERMAARSATLMKLRQARQPVEDMEIDDPKEFPPLDRVENSQLDGRSFADLLMVMEFISNFGHVLKIEKAEVPTINEVHAGLLNDRRHLRALRTLVKTLLLLVLEYPGLPAGNASKTLLGQLAKDVGVTDMNMSELLRMFLSSRDDEGKRYGTLLNDQPFEALSAADKVSILAFMCNELLYCRNVVREIEGNIDVIAKLKSDRWILESKQRHMKIVKASKRKNDTSGGGGLNIDGEEAGSAINSDQTCDATATKNEPAAIIPKDEEEDNDSSDSEFTKADSNIGENPPKRQPKTLFGITAGEIESISPQEKLMSVEEVDKELERLNKEMLDLRAKVGEVSVRVRASPFGQDRYNRYYWVLPHYSGVLVEGVESGASNNPAIRLPNARVSSPSGCRSVSPPKHHTWCATDDVHACVSDILETVTATDEDFDMDDFDQLLVKYDDVKNSKALKFVSHSNEMAWEQSCEVGKSSHSRNAQTKHQKRARPIPLDKQDGWWIVDDPRRLDTIQPSLHHRGIRERQLNRMLSKYSAHVKRAAFDGEKNRVQLCAVQTSDDQTAHTIKLQAARRLLNMIRQLEEKVFHANVHVKGWKQVEQAASPPHAATTDSSASESSCDSVLDEHDKYWPLSVSELLEIVRGRLLHLEMNIERRYFMPAFNHSSIIKEPAKPSTSADTVSSSASCSDQVEDIKKSSSRNDGTNNVNAANKTSETEENGDSKDAGDDEDDDDDIPLALERWRIGVSKASSIAQLSMCLEELDAQVAWEKSVMKASCQICRSGDNESQLLLCDGCDLGYHTYCFKPKLDTVPDGDWFCPECIAKATRRPCCLLCCRQANRPMIVCGECSRNFHLDCLHSPAKKTRGVWVCAGCSAIKGKTGKLDSDDNKPAASVEAQPKRKSTSKKSPKAAKSTVQQSLSNGTPPMSSPLDFQELCSIMLAELDSHKEAGPFKTPVDTKGCPLYKKVIKQPMDLSTIQNKLSSKKYENESQFIDDIKLMFENCRTFNEDDSAVGKGGHVLRRFFNKRWKDLKESNGKKSC